jgi:anhydro-N-acetylmuramic acid kinase
VSGYRVVYDFRSADVAKGGQGAPLVPMGDHLLFSAYRYCLNLGGIANISTVSGNQRVAWDIVPANMVLNLLASRLGYLFDRDGQLAAEGALIPELLNQLEELAYFSSPPPKTLGREWMEHYLLPLLDQLYSVKDILRTYTEFVAMQINKEASANDGDLILVTGGGTWNRFLTERIASLTNAQLVIPEKTLIDFKEALIFGFLGLLRYLNLDNVFGSVTGAPRDHSAGSIALP